MIYDCFTFFNELDLLELRLRELSGVVDRFVLVESPLRFSGKEKPLFYQQNKQRFAKWHKQIIALEDSFPLTSSSTWQREEHQRSAILAGIAGAEDNDLVFVSDADEIISAETVKRVGGWIADQDYPVHLSQRHYMYQLNLRRFLDWHMAVGASAKVIRKFGPQGARMAHIKFGMLAPDAGWHFAYMGGTAAVINKLESFSHCYEQTATELVAKYRAGTLTPEENDACSLRQVMIDETFPEHVQSNLGWWKERGFIK